ncbi:AI-2E family transporter, partial [Thioclava sp. BHET1]
MYNWAAKHLSEPATRGKTAQKMQAAEQRVARYFLTITMINAGLGIVTAVSFQFIGLPSAISWGILAFLVNFIPYLGPGLGTLGMLYAGLAAYDGAMSGAPAAIYLVFIVLESQFVTPTLIGRNVAVNS